MPAPTDLSRLCTSVETLSQTGLPYFIGTLSLSASELVLFYRSSDGVLHGCVDFANAADSDIKALANACQPAALRLNGLHNAPKEGKLEASNCGLQINPFNHGIVECIHEELFNNSKNSASPEIRLEMSELNIYGPGSSCKAPVDRARGSDTFGSLIVIMPTKHDGGSLTLRHAGQEWTAIANAPNPPKEEDSPNIPRTSFSVSYSDVECEVTQITSGYIVTLTYLISFATSQSETLDVHSSSLHALQENLGALLAQKDFLPDGGYIGFKVLNEYPVKGQNDFSDLQNHLRGADSHMWDACNALGLKTSLRLFYMLEDHPDYGMERKHATKEVVEIPYFSDEYGASRSIAVVIQKYRARRVKDLSLATGEELDDTDSDAESIGSVESESWDGPDFEYPSWGIQKKQPKKRFRKLPIRWINPESDAMTKVTSVYAYSEGIDAAGVSYKYGEVAVVAKVGPHGSRPTADSEPTDAESEPDEIAKGRRVAKSASECDDSSGAESEADSEIEEEDEE